MAPDLTSEQRSLLDEVVKKWAAGEAVHTQLRPRWERLDALYHSRKDFLTAYSTASDADRPGVMRDGEIEFNGLFIPMAFGTVETVLPRLLSNRPRMLWTPRDKASEKNVENVRVICDAQQHRANYELKLQTTGRSGLIYGLGIQKLTWRREVRMQKTLRRRRLGMPGYAVKERPRVLWDDPDVQDVSIFDARWDPYGDSMENMGYFVHRTWRSTEYVWAKIESGEWGDIKLTKADLEGSTGGKEQYTAAWQNRRRKGENQDLREPIHEVWEFHDGKRVIVVVDRTWPVANFPNPAWHGRMPFHAYRPTEVLHEFAGKGEIEPIEDLQDEFNLLRSNRMWNALMTLHKSYFYEDGTIDPNEVRIGPGTLNAVNGNGMPLRDMLVPVEVGDIPNAGYQEEASMLSDIERATGISDTVQGTGDAGQTATGVQLIQSAASIRIQLKTRRVELELITPEAQDWLALNQQHIMEERDVAVPATPDAMDPDRRWTWRTVGPEQLAGEFDVEPDGGSTAPDNIPQMRQDAQMLLQLANLPFVDQRKIVETALEKLGLKNAEAYMAPDMTVPPETLDLIRDALVQDLGVDEATAYEVIAGALQEAQTAREQGGAPGDAGGQDQMMSGEPPQAPEQAAA